MNEMAMVGIPLSVLDLSILAEGQTSSAALAATTALAQTADRLGYRRFWVAEHHNMPTVACTAPAVLMAHLAAVTSRITVGSGGVMLPNHAPLVVGEQFALLEALHPGRIDLGIGRAPGTDGATAAALRRTTDLSADDFPRDLLDLMGLFGDRRVEHGLWERFATTPQPTSVPALHLLGSSDYSAQLAAYLGLPFAYAHHFDLTGGDLDATARVAALYRNSFRPSVALSEPHLMITANVLVADDAEQAEWHAAPGRLTMYWRRTRGFLPMPSPAEASTHPDLPTARRMPTNRIVGDRDAVAAALTQLIATTGADELMVTCVAHDLEPRVRSLELLAGV